MEVIMENSNSRGTNITRHGFNAMVDMGANIGVAPRWLAEELQLEIVKPKCQRFIGTAKEGSSLVIEGWVSPEGYTGMIAMVEGATDILLSVTQMQTRGMGVRAPPNASVCHLTVQDGDKVRDFMELQQLAPTNLYFVDIRVLIFRNKMPLVILQPGDGNGVELVEHVSHLAICRVCTLADRDKEDAGGELTANPVVAKSRRKTKPSASASLRVWRLHETTNHTNLRTLAIMVREMILRNANCTSEEIMLVSDHQDCWACSISKWKKLPKQVTSELAPNIFGAHWSVDIVGPYKVLGIGGFKYEFVFVERSQGYLEVFFGKLKSELVACIPLLSIKLRSLAWMMESIRVDMGSVENGQEFALACQQANSDIGQAGVVINPANVGCQEANVVE
jgi:hypothetical protein